MPSSASRPRKKNRLKRFLSVLGPGLTTGAADDDPSGIATYSIAGAQLGTSLLWTAFVTWPLMAFVQLTCASIGMVTGRGLGRRVTSEMSAMAVGYRSSLPAQREHYHHWR